MSQSQGTSPAVLVLLVLLGAVIVIAVAIPSMVHSHRPDPSVGAIGALKTIVSGQLFFRERYKDGDKLLYATLTELSDQQLIDPVLGSGTKAGYVFVVAPGTGAPEYVYWATATPTAALRKQDPQVRSFFTNHEGVIFYTTTGAVAPITSLAAVPRGWIPIGK